MLYGLLMTGEKYGVETVRILDFPFVRITVPQEKNPFLMRWMLRRGAKALRRQGVCQAVIPTEKGFRELMEKEGVFPVSTRKLREEIAAEWVGQILRSRDIGAAQTTVAVEAELLSAEVVRTVTQLSLRHRYVYLLVPRGGEILARRLRREYGVSLQIAPGNGADVLVRFGEGERCGKLLTLDVWDESVPLPPLILPPNQEQALPAGAERGQLIAALRSAGALKHLSVGQM